MGDAGIRDATVADLDVLRDIFRRASWSNEGDRHLLEQHPEWLDLDDTAVREGRTVVATDDGEVAGFASTSSGDGFTELDDLFVDPDRRRAGHARRLVEHLAAGAGPLEVTANDHALAFYEAAGFVAVGTAETAGGPAVRMRRAPDG